MIGGVVAGVVCGLLLIVINVVLVVRRNRRHIFDVDPAAPEKRAANNGTHGPPWPPSPAAGYSDRHYDDADTGLLPNPAYGYCKEAPPVRQPRPAAVGPLNVGTAPARSAGEGPVYYSEPAVKQAAFDSTADEPLQANPVYGFESPRSTQTGRPPLKADVRFSVMNGMQENPLYQQRS